MNQQASNLRIAIRPATHRDLERIGQIAAATDLFPAEMLDDMIADYLDQISPDLWFVGEAPKAPSSESPASETASRKTTASIVAFGFCEPERMTEGTWNLLAIGVDPDHQSAGIGAAMMRYLEDRLRQKEARILLVETMGTPEFARTRAFYLRNGYEIEARIREFYEAGADKVVFWKHLGARASEAPS